MITTPTSIDIMCYVSDILLHTRIQWQPQSW